MPKFWLMKSEPDVYSFDDLLSEPEQTALWEGVRNYQARNFMRDEMRRGDKVLFYHSSTKPPHVAGIAEIAREAYPDPTQFDPNSHYFDEKASEAEPRWVVVDVKAIRKLAKPVTLETMKAEAALADMPLLRRGNRLSVMPIKEKDFETVLKLAER